MKVCMKVLQFIPACKFIHIINSKHHFLIAKIKQEYADAKLCISAVDMLQ